MFEKFNRKRYFNKSMESKENKNPNIFAKWIKRFGVAGFMFFLVKGLLWLIVPALIAYFVSYTLLIRFLFIFRRHIFNVIIQNNHVRSEFLIILKFYNVARFVSFAALARGQPHIGHQR